jgi:hypothetical protein
MGGPDDMARAVVDRAAARAKAGAAENAFAEEQRVKKEAIVRDKRIIIEDWERCCVLVATDIVDYVPFMVHRVTNVCSRSFSKKVHRSNARFTVSSAWKILNLICGCKVRTVNLKYFFDGSTDGRYFRDLFGANDNNLSYAVLNI